MGTKIRQDGRQTTAVVITDAPGLKAAGAELASYREKLRLGKHFFVVDDSEDACRMNTEILSKPYGGRGGFETKPKTALEEIVKRVSGGELDVLVVDMDMPGMSGRELLLELAKKGIYVPFVIVSGGLQAVDLRVAAMMTAVERKVMLKYDTVKDKAEPPVIEVPNDKLGTLNTALKQAIDNAGRATEVKKDGEVRMIPGSSTVAELKDKMAGEHFKGKDYGDVDKIAFITIADNGSGMPESVLTAWRRREDTLRDGAGAVTSGLRLMREAAGEVNDGTVSIESSAGGTEVTFYFAEKQKNRGKT